MTEELAPNCGSASLKYAVFVEAITPFRGTPIVSCAGTAAWSPRLFRILVSSAIARDAINIPRKCAIVSRSPNGSFAERRYSLTRDWLVNEPDAGPSPRFAKLVGRWTSWVGTGCNDLMSSFKIR